MKKGKKTDVLNHQLEEWRYLNEYINKMDVGYQQSILGITTVFGVLATVLTVSDSDILKWGFFVLPLGLLTVFSYMSYQFRITAILRGHLAALEKSMNTELGQNVHMWNSALVETFMAHNNLINNGMMYPILAFVTLLMGYSVYITWILLETINFGKILFAIYWIIITIGIAIVFLPFLFNTSIRHATENEDNVLKKYDKYLKQRKKTRL